MKKTFTLFLLNFIIVTCFSQGIAPFIHNAAGGHSDQGYYRFEWSVGEMALVNQMTSSSGDIVMTNGFLQPYILRSTTNDFNSFGSDEIKVFPVPATDYVEINFFTKQKGKLKMVFFDGVGRKVLSHELRGNGVDIIERIPVSKFSAGAYLLNIELEAAPGSVSKQSTFKVIIVH